MAQQLSANLTLATNFPLVPLSESNTGRTQTMADTIEAAASAGDSAIFMIEIPVNSKIHSVRLATDDLGTGCTMSVGLYKRDSLGTTFTAVSANCIASAVDVATAATSLTEYRFSAANIDTANKKAWELAGLSSRPDYKQLFLGVSFASAAAAGTVSAIVTFSSTA